MYVRVRPLSDSEVKANYQNVMTKEDDRTCVMASDTATASDVRDWEVRLCAHQVHLNSHSKSIVSVLILSVATSTQKHDTFTNKISV